MCAAQTEPGCYWRAPEPHVSCGAEVDEPDLVIPHPRMWERRIVRAPLADLAPDLVRKGWQRRVTGGVRLAGTL